MAKIRQEINIIDTPLTWTANTSGTASNAKIQIDSTQYSGTVSAYLEVVTNDSADTLANAYIRTGTTTYGDCSITAGDGINYTRKRGNSFTLPLGTNEFVLYVISSGNTSEIGRTIKSARVILIQDSAPLTSTETQIEIGNNESSNSTAVHALTSPKYWTYTSANWDGTCTFFAEATYSTSSTKGTATITLQEDDGSWNFSDLVTIVSGGFRKILSLFSCFVQALVPPFSWLTCNKVLLVNATANIVNPMVLNFSDPKAF